jgi:hypothetical protein
MARSDCSLSSPPLIDLQATQRYELTRSALFQLHLVHGKAACMTVGHDHKSS